MRKYFLLTKFKHMQTHQTDIFLIFANSNIHVNYKHKKIAI